MNTELKEIKILDEKHIKAYQDEIINRIKLENTSKINTFESCCGSRVSKELINFIAKFMIIFSILLFSFYMVLSSTNNSDKNIFIIIINSIFSVFIPSPSYKEKTTKEEKK